jgi:hypothetical protein
MKALLYLIFTAVLVFAGWSTGDASVRDSGVHGGVDRSSCPGYYDFSDTQGVYSGRDFGLWRSNQQERIEEGLRSGNLTESDYSRLGQELENIESFHDRVLSLKGRITAKHQEKMTEMEAQLSGDISVSIQKNCQG